MSHKRGGEPMPYNYKAGQFPPQQLDWQRLIPMLGTTAAAIARYDGALTAMPNPDVLLAPLTTQEAVLSSRIEGTQATMGEVLEFEAGRPPDSSERRDDIQEVVNYRRAMAHAEEMLETVPLGLRVVREAHRILMSGARGAGKAPGEYRRVPVWIGPPGCGIDEATFLPIGADQLVEAMSAWERFIHASAPDRLLQIAILHAEFEALHPFLDGNGRLGRMLVPLLLCQYGLIREPMFYISAHFESNRDAYYEGLLSVSRDNDWTDWCRFFLQAMKSQAEDNLRKAEGIIDLYDEMKSRIAALTKSRYAIHALDWIFQYPIFGSTHLVNSGVPAKSARRVLNTLCEDGLLETLVQASGRRPAILAFPHVLRIAEGDSATGA